MYEDKSGSTSALAGENGLDRAASRYWRRASPRRWRGSSSTRTTGRTAASPTASASARPAKASTALPPRAWRRAPPRRRRGSSSTRTTGRTAASPTKAPARPRGRRERPRPRTASDKGSILGDERRRDDGAAPALQEPRGGRQQVRRKRQHVRGGRRERPRPRCLQGLGDERRRDDGAAPALQEPRGGRQQVRRKRQHVRAGRRERPRPRCLQGIRDERRRDDGAARRKLYKNHGADGSKSDEAPRRARAAPGSNGHVDATKLASMARRAVRAPQEPRGGRQQVDESGSASPRCLAPRRAPPRRRQQVPKGRRRPRAAMAGSSSTRTTGRTASTDAFDSETTKGAAKAELDLNKYQAGGVHALHAIEQVSYVQSETMVPLQGTIKQAAPSLLLMGV